MTNELADEVDNVAQSVAETIVSSALGEIPGGFLLSSLFDAIMGEFDNKMDQLQQQLQNQIGAAISDYAKHDLKLKLSTDVDRLRAYKHEGQTADRLKDLIYHLQDDQGYFLDDKYIDALDLLPLILGFTLLRTTVWASAEKAGLSGVSVEYEVREYVSAATPLVMHLISEAVSVRLDHTRVAGIGHAPRYATWGVFDGSTQKYVVGNDEGGRRAADEKLVEYRNEVVQYVRNDLGQKYLKPLLDLARIYNAPTYARTSLTSYGHGFGPLGSQYGDVKDARCPDGEFVTGMYLYKHHNNMAIGLISRRYDAATKSLSQSWSRTENSVLGGTTNENVSGLYADFKQFACPAGTAAVGARFYTHHNNIAIELLYKSVEGPERSGRASDANLGATSNTNLKDRWMDTTEVHAPTGHVVVGCKLYSHQNQLAIEVISADLAAVIANAQNRDFG